LPLHTCAIGTIFRRNSGELKAGKKRQKIEKKRQKVSESKEKRKKRRKIEKNDAKRCAKLYSRFKIGQYLVLSRASSLGLLTDSVLRGGVVGGG